MRFAVLALIPALSVSCASREARLARSKAFQSYPPEVQEKIKAGEVEAGFTKEMVVLAVGKPDRKYTRTSDKGNLEIWAYVETRARSGLGVSLGIGAGSRSGYGGGISVGTRPEESVERLRIAFQDGKVASVDRLK